MAKTALIVGISGQDGAFLSQFLLSKGYRVIGTSRDADISPFSGLKALNIFNQVTLTSMAPNDFRSVLQVVSRFLPDEIYNLAGQTSVGLSFNQPVETMESISIGTLNLLEVVRFVNKKIRIYNAGSSECFGDTGIKLASETTPFNPRSPYAVAKAAAYWQVANYREAYNLFACSGLLFNHESPLRPERFVTKKIIRGAQQIQKGAIKKITLGNLDIARDWGWAPDYVKSMWLMLQAEEADDYVIATGKTHTLQDFVEKSFKYFNLDWTQHVDIDETLFRPLDIKISAANPQKALNVLGWSCTYSLDKIISMMCHSSENESI